jgi:hypothetical protein
MTKNIMSTRDYRMRKKWRNKMALKFHKLHIETYILVYIDLF